MIAPGLTAKEEKRLNALCAAAYPLTKPERKRLSQLLQKDGKARRAAIARAEGKS